MSLISFVEPGASGWLRGGGNTAEKLAMPEAAEAEGDTAESGGVSTLAASAIVGVVRQLGAYSSLESTSGVRSAACNPSSKVYVGVYLFDSCLWMFQFWYVGDINLTSATRDLNTGHLCFELVAQCLW